MPPWPVGEPDTFAVIYTVGNPLDSLPEKTDTLPPRYMGRDSSNWPIFLQRDSTEQSPGDTFKIKSNVNGDTVKRYVVNKKVDVVPLIWDRSRSPGYHSVGIDRIYYSIRGINGVTQGSKGFSFRLNMPSDFIRGDTTLSKQVLGRVYADTITSYFKMPYRYIVSNTDNLTWMFDNLAYLVGYWNTKQHKDRAWDGNPAESLKVARFPDNYYWVKVTAMDHAGNTAYDSIKCIVNNFPPLIKQTYPDSGATGVARGCTIKVWFDQPMDTASATAGFHLRIKDSTDDVSGSKAFDSTCTVLTFIPSQLLKQKTEYVIKDSSSSKDVADSTMGVDHLSPFSTRPLDIHVSSANLVHSHTRIDVRDSLAHRYPTPISYADLNDPPGGPSPVWGQKVAIDKIGNRYVVENSSNGPYYRLAKYDSLGGFSRGALNDCNLRSVTCDTQYVYVTKYTYDDTTRNRNRVIKLNMSNLDTVGCIWSPDSVRFMDVAYSPANNKLYVSAQYYPGGFPVDFRLFRYSTQGDSEACMVDSSIHNPGRLSAGRSYLYHARDWYTTVRNDTVRMYDLNLSTVWWFPAGDSSPYANGSNIRQTVLSLIADYGHLYTLNRTMLPDDTTKYYWVNVFDYGGRHLRACSLTVRSGGDTLRYGAIAVYPSILGLPGFYFPPPGGGGNTDGGPQTDNANSLLPRVYALGQSYPNPAKGGLRIDYALPKESQVSLKVYNVMGQMVRTLREGKEKPGFYKAEWDGKDQLGKRVASGVYLYRMEAGEFRKTRKLVVIR